MPSNPLSPPSVSVQVNGTPRDVAPGTTVAALLAMLELDARSVAVEVNLELVPRARHAQAELHERDRVEVVSLVGGG
jgi:sulfur carrier protein